MWKILEVSPRPRLSQNFQQLNFPLADNYIVENIKLPDTCGVGVAGAGRDAANNQDDILIVHWL